MEADIKLIKWGIIFFSEPAHIKFNDDVVQVSKTDGSNILLCPPCEIKRAAFNGNNGMFTIKSKDGQKCNFVFKEVGQAEQFGALLDKFGVKGFIV